MCGHVGMAGLLEYKDEAAFKRMLLLDYLRGPDSTGVAALRKNDEVKLVKIPSHPLDLFEMKKYTETVSGHQSKVFLGHNRLATLGKVNSVNAHPFEYGDVVGAHNGTLDKESWSRLNSKLGYETTVDSAALIACIDKLGIEETISLCEKGKTSATGAWALVWFDTGKNTVNFLRNEHRPFWFAYSKDFQKVFWASEWQTIEYALKMSAQSYDLYVDTTDGNAYRFFQTQEDLWYQFRLDDLMVYKQDKPIVKPVVKEVKGREPPAVAYAGAGAPFQGGWNSTTNSHGTTLPVVQDNTRWPETIDLTGSKKEPLGNYIQEHQFKEWAKYGCSWCSGDVEIDDVGISVYPEYEAVVCASCAGNGDHSRIYLPPFDFNEAYEASQTSKVVHLN